MKIEIYIAQVLKKIYKKFHKVNIHKTIFYQADPDAVTNIFISAINSGKPFMVGRFGSTEISCMLNYIGIQKGPDFINYIKGNSFEWWWNKNIVNQMEQWSGFFPSNPENLNKFCVLMNYTMKQIDVFARLSVNDVLFYETMNNPYLIKLETLDPYWSKTPWTSALKGKRVVVVHPFASTILSQYDKRKYLFEKEDTLPEFASIRVVKAVQSIGGSKEFKDWFEALDSMKAEIAKEDFDVCLIGCGAYGFPLAAYVKEELGKIAFHIGGSLQLLFGIRGARWENNYRPSHELIGRGVMDYPCLPNKYWVRPNENEKPSNFKTVEDGCYW